MWPGKMKGPGSEVIKSLQGQVGAGKLPAAHEHASQALVGYAVIGFLAF